jgi:hypothetical protein
MVHAAAVDRLDVTLAVAHPERSRAAVADLLPEQRIPLTLDTTRTFLIAEPDVETPLERVAEGVSEIMAAGNRLPQSASDIKVCPYKPYREQ